MATFTYEINSLSPFPSFFEHMLIKDIENKGARVKAVSGPTI